MKRAALDTNCVIAAVCRWHQHHLPTVTAIAEVTSRGGQWVPLAPVILEAFAVLTRLPMPHRLTPDTALALLEQNWGQADVISLPGAEHWPLLRDCARRGVAGGTVYDALIAACAARGGVDCLLTWNTSHLRRVTHPTIRVASPDELV